MQSGLYVSLSGQMALMRRIETIADNVANANTTGFRAEQVRFETVLSQVPLDPVAFASEGNTHISRRSGEIVRTDNQFDVAIQGDAWLAINTPAGQVYTRDGRFRMNEMGELQTLGGYAVLDVGGAPILLDPNAGPPTIARDGTITQGNRQAGVLGLFQIDQRATLTRYENSGVISNIPATPVLEFTQVGVSQGYVERANVNPVLEMTRLVMVSRAYEAITNAINQSDSTLSEAVRTLGSKS
jgi:flagellar basal-body rod protein FlgF